MCVLCEKDQALASAIQEKFARRAGSLYRAASGHSPFLSMTGELADVLDEALTKAASEAIRGPMRASVISRLYDG
jgi:hypothetical protein